MFPGAFGSQDSSSHRNHHTLSEFPATEPEVGSLSSLVESPDFSQILPGSATPWSAQSHTTIEHSQSTRDFGLSVPPQHSTSTLDSSPNQPRNQVVLNDQQRPITRSSLESQNPTEGHLALENTPGLGISSYPMSAVSDAYFASPMQHPHHYAWANRPYHPVQAPHEHMSPPFASSQSSYSSTGYPVGYLSHSSGPLPSYAQQVPGSYLTAPGSAARQSQPRSPPMARPFQSASTSNTPPLPQQPLMTTPPYMMSQPAYYFAEPTSIPSQPSSINSQPPPMVSPEPMYSPSNSAATSDTDQVRVVNSRPRPQCWDHGCNGREFSTFSNLLRHQREKSGVVAKAECPICGAVFTRTTARNIHVAQGKCKASGRESSTE
ncbi:hypothetical protein PENANT_c016G01466 [Penicillium antarcticum]|uniref:C2H2-type domain-containing protein n=1 Tax=Penicillium antarcticum TaxID=416450 RepID=A0A1V6Q2L3_9EURO|nr:hypothetical protein PENANT_c016G01466 [Penicillium antarcticum]